MNHIRGKFSLLFSICLIFCSISRAQDKPELDEQHRALLAALESQILYHPRVYDTGVIDDFIKNGGKRIDYTTSQGKQTAWLIVPANGVKIEKLWLVCGGNATLAMDFEPFCRAMPFKSDAFLMVDYPGYGECAGAPSPKSIRENMKLSVLAVVDEVKIDPAKQPEKLSVFGHSLGCAAALLAVEEFHLRSAVLCAPFTNTIEMAHKMLGVGKDCPLQHKFDNRVGLAELQQNHGHAWLFHGDADEIIPVQMSKTLAGEFKETVKLKIVAGGHHNDVLEVAGQDLIDAMTEARK